jgi:hypothetical protein
MENTFETEQKTAKPPKKCGFWVWCAAIIWWLFILLFAAMLLGGLYFKAPWKVLTLVAVLLALLTVVPKPWRKYGWLALAAAVLAVTVWIFIPEKDTGDWRPYTFDEELAALESKRVVPAEDDAAPLYEELFLRWKESEETDPFPEEADDDCDGTTDRPWTAAEFPEVVAWLTRHENFFKDVIAATQKPACFFPAAVTVAEFPKIMERFPPIKTFSFHLIRASYLDIGENRTGAWEKQTAILNLGKHLNQQPMLIDVLTGVAIEGMAWQTMRKTLIDPDQLPDLSTNDYLAAITPIQTSHFNHQEKWKQIIAYENLFTKNFFGMFYEVNSEGKIRYSRFKTLISAVNGAYPDELMKPTFSYWADTGQRLSRVFFWFCGLPKNPGVISGWIDESYGPLEQTDKTNQNGWVKIDTYGMVPFELNCKYMVSRLVQTVLPSYKRVQDIFDSTLTRKKGTELFCDLVLYQKQHGQYPDTLDTLWPSDEERQAASEQYAGFVYHKTEKNFMLHHIGLNNINDKGKYEMPEWDPNGLSIERRNPTKDDILIWPEKLEEDD